MAGGWQGKRIGPMGELAKLTKVRTALAAARTFDELINVRDQAAAVVTYARAIGLSIENLNAAIDVKLCAERKAGALLAGMGLHGSNQHGSKLHDATSLDSLGITKIQSHRWQKLAAIPEEWFSEFVREATEDGAELTTAGMMRQWSHESKPSNGRSLSSGDTLPAALERLHAAIGRIYSDWPDRHVKSLAEKLRAYADELDATGELTL